MNRRSLTLLLSDDQADAFDALRFFGEEAVLGAAIADVLDRERAEGEVDRMLRLRRRRRIGMRVVS